MSVNLNVCIKNMSPATGVDRQSEETEQGLMGSET